MKVWVGALLLLASVLALGDDLVIRQDDSEDEQRGMFIHAGFGRGRVHWRVGGHLTFPSKGWARPNVRVGVAAPGTMVASMCRPRSNRRHALLMSLGDQTYANCLAGARANYSPMDAARRVLKPLAHTPASTACAQAAMARIRSFSAEKTYQACIASVGSLSQSFLAVGEGEEAEAGDEEEEHPEDVYDDDDESDGDDAHEFAGLAKGATPWDEPVPSAAALDPHSAAHGAARSGEVMDGGEEEEEHESGSTGSTAGALITRAVDGVDGALSSPDLLLLAGARAQSTVAKRRCAGENGFCKFRGWRKVTYGARGIYTSRYFSNGVSCSNGVFGDPIVGVVKSCYVHGSPPAVGVVVRPPAILRARCAGRGFSLGRRDAQEILRCQRSVVPSGPVRPAQPGIPAVIKAPNPRRIAGLAYEEQKRAALGDDFYREFDAPKPPAGSGATSSTLSKEEQLRRHTRQVDAIAMRAARPVLADYMRWFTKVYVKHGGIIPVMPLLPSERTSELDAIDDAEEPIMPHGSAAGPPAYPPWNPLPQLLDPDVYDPATLPGKFTGAEDAKLWGDMPRPMRKLRKRRASRF